MKFFTKEFWTTRDILQQVAHFLQGFLYSIILSKIFFTFGLFPYGILIGLGVEIFQYFFIDERDLRLEDRIRDLLFWILGSVLIFIVFK